MSSQPILKIGKRAERKHALELNATPEIHVQQISPHDEGMIPRGLADAHTLLKPQ